MSEPPKFEVIDRRKIKAEEEKESRQEPAQPAPPAPAEGAGPASSSGRRCRRTLPREWMRSTISWPR